MTLEFAMLGLLALLNSWELYALNSLRREIHERLKDHGQRIVRLENRALSSVAHGPFGRVVD